MFIMENIHNNFLYTDLSVDNNQNTSHNKLCNCPWCQLARVVEISLVVEFGIVSNGSNQQHLRKPQVPQPPRWATAKASFC